MNIKNLAFKVINPFSQSVSDFVSLKITERDIKIIQLKRKKTSCIVSSIAECKTPEMSVIENVIIDSDAVSNSISSLYQSGRFKGRDVAIGLNSNEVIVKKIDIPVMAEKDIIDYAYIEVANHIPYKPDEVYVDYILLGSSEKDETKMSIFLIACKKDIIETYDSILKEAGLRLKYVDCDVFALYNIHEIQMQKATEEGREDDYKSDMSHAFINIGYSSSSAVILFNGKIMMATSSGFGTKFIDKNISDSLLDGELDHNKIEEYKKGSSEEYISCYYDYFDYITGELSMALNHYNGTNPEFPVEHIHISGGGILLENALMELETRLGVKVTLFNPFEEILKVNKSIEFNGERDGYRFALVAGLSARG